jgi:hypothetical protein
MTFFAFRELLVRAAVDTGVPKTFGDYLGWIIKFILYLWDEPVREEWNATQSELRSNGIENSAYTKDYEYALVQRTGRNVYSIRRSLKRIRAKKD